NSKCQQILKHSQIDLIDGWLAACELLGPEKFCPIIVCYLKKMSNVLDFLEPLVEEIKTITENLKVLGFKSRYVNNRLKSFGSVFRNWLPELAAGGYDQFAYLDGQYDLLGVRVVGLSVSDVVKVARAILGNERFAWDRAAVKNFYERPKPSGYRAWHLRTKYYPDRPKNSAV